MYEWSNGATTEDIYNLSSGSYSVIVTDINGCVGTDTIVIRECGTLVIPNVITPNGDDHNDDVVFLSSVIHDNIDKLFPGMTVKGCYQFRVTRNSDLFVDDEEVKNLRIALQGELPQWVQQQLINPEQAASIELYYRQQAGSSGSRSIFSAIGAILFGLGIILFFAYNWADFSQNAKFGIIEGAIAIAIVGALVVGPDRLAARLLLIAASVLAGRSSAIVAPKVASSRTRRGSSGAATRCCSRSPAPRSRCRATSGR